MRIVLIGAGNLATNLGKALRRAGHDIAQVFSRTEGSASALAASLGCPYTTNLDEVEAEADVFILSVKDSVLAEVVAALVSRRSDQLFVHTAGSMPMDTLPTSRRGVLYPMQTFSKERDTDFAHIPCFVEAACDEDRSLLTRLAKSVSESVYPLDSENRKYLHLAAVFCCNFANHCFALGARLLRENGGIPFEVMIPLVSEMVGKLQQMSPEAAQTGPAARGDANVMDAQARLLDNEPRMRRIYELLSESIQATRND